MMTAQPLFAMSEAEFSQLKQAVEQLKKKQDEDTRRINELEWQLKQAEAGAKQPVRSAGNGLEKSASVDPFAPTGFAGGTSAAQGSRSAHAPQAGNSFNPAMGVTLMGTLGNFSRNPEAATVPGFALADESGSAGTQGFSLGESEISLSANIDHRLYGQLTMSLDGGGAAEVEEAFIQTTSLPMGLTAKGGRFFSGIGYLNEQHLHAWDFLDAPLPYRAMLNGQLGDDGVQIRWTVPTSTFLQIGVEGFRGEGFPATPGHNGLGAASLFVKTGGDIDASNSWLGSLAYYHTDADALSVSNGADLFSGATDMGIAGMVWKWAPDGNGAERQFKWQSEFLLRRQDGLFNGLDYRGNQYGYYGQALYQFMPQWSVGVRYDQVAAGDVSSPLAGTALDTQGHTPHRSSAILMYDTSEFGRFRLQYNQDDASPSSNREILLNYTVSFGAHGAHAY
ncbi:MAG: hypothetical protein HQM04_18605 [Magnetococcales bacterium]|nr:hypothetical protein [Magnetococcales bacterium]MBF0117041.1 hypothetical protein [Magnetococcales bacterium]